MKYIGSYPSFPLIVTIDDDSSLSYVLHSIPTVKFKVNKTYKEERIVNFKRFERNIT